MSSHDTLAAVRAAVERAGLADAVTGIVPGLAVILPFGAATTDTRTRLAEGLTDATIPGPSLRTLHPGWADGRLYAAVSNGWEIVACYQVTLVEVEFPVDGCDIDDDGRAGGAR